ncbi:hypothetical protein EIL87_23540 [Saccharopolyspora rhizosphaerae]|uniref:Secreted protein n=1 Tax=Saccharopolyspora rhizosphaerae TaxID=2492662 RepID=A0A426JHQ2_9PSEU|nr:hypothetical protein [Saccharopolyspora rhizosphaerae]RRO12679.1 hypothetical protein EIL87_23540 [Saccharopolyspora rhizosphaerae]
MRSWTTRTVKAAVMAAGLATAGTGAANAAGTSGIEKPDLSSVPDEISADLPAHACKMQEGPAFHPTKAPCADAQLNVSSPNVVKKVGADVTKTGHGIAGELQDGRPVLAPGKPNRVLGHVFAETTRVSKMTKTRPTVGGSVNPGHLGVVYEHTPDAALLDTEIGPREPNHQGFSALDTAVALTAAQGYESEPISIPVALVAPTLNNNPLQTSGEPLTLAKPSDALPAAEKTPVLAEADKAVGGVSGAPPQQISGVLPQS